MIKNNKMMEPIPADGGLRAGVTSWTGHQSTTNSINVVIHSSLWQYT